MESRVQRAEGSDSPSALGTLTLTWLLTSPHMRVVLELQML